MITIKEAKTKEDLLAFTKLANKIYAENPYWVAPITKDYIAYIQGKDNELADCPHKILLAYKDNEVVGRVIVYVDEELNRYQNSSVGNFAEYEAVDDLEVAEALINACLDFCKDHGLAILKGPFALPGGEDHRGFMVNGFDQIPTIMNIYNMDYYPRQMEDLGLKKYLDVYAYAATPEDIKDRVDHLERILPQVQKRYKFHIDPVDIKKNLQRELDDVYAVLQEGLPKEWEDFKPITHTDVQNIFQQLKPFAVEDLIVVARTDEGEPIGFAISLPDYNEILHGFHGKLGPLQAIQFLLKRKSIKRVRLFVLIIVPKYHQKGVSAAIYYTLFKNAMKRGFTELEGSTIWEYNQPMINDVERIGAKRSITYRIFQKKI